MRVGDGVLVIVCGTDDADVRNYKLTRPYSPLPGPASVTLYPELIKAIRVLIYNGDADSCVPYVGNQEWTSSMVDQGVVTELKPWHPWYSDVKGTAPAGYATTYSNNFTFITIKLAGHQVPKNVPATSLAFFKRFLTDGVF
jgi:carboxypeptidase C (cathepsin A)